MLSWRMKKERSATELTDEDKGFLFVLLKTVIDVLDQGSETIKSFVGSWIAIDFSL